MKKPSLYRLTPTLLALLAIAACSSATQPPRPAAMQPTIGNPATTSPAANVARGRQPASEADVYFMSGMIPHHAQAVKIAAWAPTHGASNALRILCERIVVGQRDEIELMQTWLRDRGQKVPAADATHMRMSMNGMEHDMLMPGMLNDEELAQLDAARGVEFDRLFLKAMIKHHEGAISMVDQLFASHSALQDDVIFKFANDVYADQTTEIDRMQKMLAALSADGRDL